MSVESTKTFGSRFARGTWYLVKRILLIIIVFVVILRGLLEVSAVQNWMAYQAAEFFSNSWQMKVKIGKMRLSLFDGVNFDEFYIEDSHSDTLFYAREIKMTLDVVEPWNKHINIRQAHIKNGVLHYIRHEEERLFELQKIIKFFQPEHPVEVWPEHPLRFGISNANFENFAFRFHDHIRQVQVDVQASFCTVVGKDVDLVGKYVDAEEFCLDEVRLAVHIHEYDSSVVDTFTFDTKPKSLHPSFPRWNVMVNHLAFDKVHFTLKNDRKEVDTTRTLDFNDMDVRGISLDIDSFLLEKGIFSGIVNQIKGREVGGFELRKLAGRTILSDKKLAVQNLELKTNNSTFRDSLVLKYETYRDYLDFANKIKINANLGESFFTFRDIATFAPKILANPFIKANIDEEIKVKGLVKNSKISKVIRIKDMELSLGNHTQINGKVNLRDITNPDATFMDLSVEQLKTKSAALSELLSFIRLSKQFSTLGNLRFEGNFVGYFQDFVAEGLLKTDLGWIKSDLHMDIIGGKTKAKYSGDLALIDFDFGRLTGIKDFGKVTVASNESFLRRVDVNRKKRGINGEGFTLGTLHAVMKRGIIKELEFKGYKYQDIQIGGLFERKKFDGKILSKDKNLDIFFNGLVDFNGDLPKIDILGSVSNMDLQKLNLVPQERVALQIDSIIVDAIGNSVDNFDGKIYIDHISGCRGADEYHLDSIRVLSINSTAINGDTLREVHLRSDILSVDVERRYRAVELVQSLKQFAKANYPNFFRDLDYRNLMDSSYSSGVPPAVFDTADSIGVQDVVVKVSMKDSRNFTKLIAKDFKRIKDLSLSASFKGEEEELTLDGHVGEVKFGDITIAENDLRGRGRGRIFDLNNKIKGIYLKDSIFLPSFELDLHALGDTLRFSTEISDLGKVASSIALDGKLSFLPNALQINLDSVDLVFLGTPWQIREDNYIRFGKGKLEVHAIRLTNKEQLIELNNRGSKGLSACMQNIDLGWWYNRKPLPEIDLEGRVSADLLVEDLFKMQNLNAHVSFHDLSINEEDWGRADLYVHADSLNARFNGIFKHGSPLVDSIRANGYIIPAFAAKTDGDKNRLNFDFDIKRAKASIIEYFLTKQLSYTDGNVSAKGTLSGTPKRLGIVGVGTISDLTTKINSLQTTYYIPEGKIALANDGFHIQPKLEFDILEDRYESGGLVIYDEKGGEAFIGGAIRHDRLKNFGLEFKLVVPQTLAIPNSNKKIKNRFLAMRTTKADNSTFYGTVYVTNGMMDFYGPFNRMKLIVDASTAKDTRLVLPLDDAEDVEDVQFVRFVDRSASTTTEEKTDEPLPTKGLDIELSVSVTPEAKAELIFNERTGDIISGRGEGRLRINYTPSGELTMHGDYTIKEGNYLFTFGQLINKSLDVKEGGVISWNGDPYNAQIDLQGVYNAKVSPYNLVVPYVATNSSLKRIANQKAPIAILAEVTGTLYEMNITFQMEVGEQVDPRLRTLINSALSNMGSNELNRQVFGAIVLQQFLPQDDSDGQILNVVSTTVNTLTEMLSQQLNNHINDLLSQVLSDVEGVDLVVDLGVNLSDNTATTIEDVQNSQVRLALNPTFLDGKLKMHIGGTADIGGNGLNVDGNAQYFGGDFTIEYQLTENGQLSLRAYSRTENTILGRTMRYGGGLSFRKEFNNFRDLFDPKNRKALSKAIEQELKKY